MKIDVFEKKDKYNYNYHLAPEVASPPWCCSLGAEPGRPT
jgi:hypothetical protein